MDIFERFNSKFGKWYDGLFGGDAGELRPKDVLRQIIAAMEDGRKEGFDGKVYVPNKYILELAVGDADEREYLLSFLDEEELVAVLQKFMAQHDYYARGPLDFTIAEVPEEERESRREKLRVRGRFEKGEGAAPEPLAARPAPPPARSVAAVPMEADDLPTVADVRFDADEPGTVPAVAWASLAVTSPEARKSHVSLTKPVFQIGRSRSGGNDLILDTDGLVSKSHARLERERDGAWTLYDLASTNGVTVGAARVDGNRILNDGDEIVIGTTRLVFGQEDARPAAPAPSPFVARPRRARLIGADGDSHVLASETLIGRSPTSDIVLPDPSVSTKHARIVSPDGAAYTLEDLASEHGTKLNGRPLPPARRVPLADGDILTFGSSELRFDGAGQ